MIRAQAAQGRLHRTDQTVARHAPIVRTVAGRQAGLGRDQHLVAAALDGLAQDFFGGAVGIDVCGVEQVDPGLQADVDQAAGLGHVAVAPGAEQGAGTAEGARAEAEDRHAQA
ncbi:hypothetical protein D3C75_1086100 [compost metagenome]